MGQQLNERVQLSRYADRSCLQSEVANPALFGAASAAQCLTQPVSSAAQFEVRFDCLVDAERALAFPCDEAGRVDLDTMSECVRNNYFYARATRGWQYAMTARIVPRHSLDYTKGRSN